MNTLSIKKLSINAIFFSSLGSLLNTGVILIAGFILARLLSPYEYGLFGMVYIFIVISGIFIDGGLSLALIREEKVTEEEYSTVFFYNLFISISIYLILFFSAKLISLFFNEPSLVVIIRVIGVSIILGALTSIQKTKLIKELKFKLQVKIEFISLILSSSLAILFAYFDYGVWALVFMYLSKSIISTFLLIVNLKWIPILKFNNNAFKKFFNFGYKMLVTGLIAKSYHTIYDLLIGRFYSTEILGLFTKSKVLKDNITTLVFDSVAKVGLPTLSRIKSDQNQFRNGFKFMIKHVSFFSFPLIMGLFVLSEPMIVILFGQQWILMIPIFRVLLISSLFTSLNSINLNILQVVGRSDLFLKIDVIKVVVGLCFIFLVFLFDLGINGLFLTIIALAIVSFFANTYYSKIFINYSMVQQLKDIFLMFINASVMGLCVYLIYINLQFYFLINLIISIFLGVIIYFILSYFLKVQELRSSYKIIRILLDDFFRSKK